MNASLAKLLECYLCFVALLSFVVVVVVYLVGFSEREIWRRDIHKSDNPPTSPFCHYIQEETSRAKNGVQKGSMAGTSKELRAVALKNFYFYYYFTNSGSFPVTGERREKCIYFYTELLNYLQNTYVGNHFC